MSDSLTQGYEMSERRKPKETTDQEIMCHNEGCARDSKTGLVLCLPCSRAYHAGLEEGHKSSYECGYERALTDCMLAARGFDTTVAFIDCLTRMMRTRRGV